MLNRGKGRERGEDMCEGERCKVRYGAREGITEQVTL